MNFKRSQSEKFAAFGSRIDSILEDSQCLSSPVTDLAFNLQVLSTAGAARSIARRNLSLSLSSSSAGYESFVSSSNCSPTSTGSGLQQTASVDDGCFLDSASSCDIIDDSPFMQQIKHSRTKLKHSLSFDVTRSKDFNECSINVFKQDNQDNDDQKPNNKENDKVDDGNDNQGRRSVDESKFPFDIISPLFSKPIDVTFSRRCNFSNNDKSIESRSSLSILNRKEPLDNGFSEMRGSPNLNVPKSLAGMFFSPLLEGNELEMDSSRSSGKKFGSPNQQTSRSHTLVRGLFRSPSVPDGTKFSDRTSNQRKLPASRILSKRSEIKLESETTPVQIKRRKSVIPDGDSNVTEIVKPIGSKRLTRCHSETEIKSILSFADSEQNLIGDFSKSYCLPLINGKHQDLKSISVNTMAAVLNGEYDDVIEKCVVIDCRYPYEFTGGHIQDAVNIYTKEEIMKEFFRERQHLPFAPPPSRRTIFVFHCEFSSERGPSLSRFLRNMDRNANKDTYPCLLYPEIYLLEGGYKAFYESFPELCRPSLYKPMLHQEHLADLKHFRAKSSSWAGEKHWQLNKIVHY